MKIYEFMQPQRSDEALGQALRGIGSVAAQAVNQGLGTNIGGVGATARAAPGFAGSAAANVNQAMITRLAQEQAQLWTQSLQAALKQSGTVDMSKLDQTQLVKIATDMVNRTLDRTGLDSYQQLVSTVEPTVKADAQLVQDRITKNIALLGKTATSSNIMPGNVEKKNQETWNLLATDIARAQNLVTFNRKQSGISAGTTTTPGGANPQLQAAMQATGINRAALAKLNAVVRQSGQKLNVTTTGSATVDALLKAAKLI